ncbi:MAG: response regulator transcription factor [Actinomycetota bacterium]|nr:response regulator transcription factor [Actinomycetota bacterium]
MSETIRVLLADDHPVVRRGLRAFLETRDGIEVLGEAADGADAVTLAEAMRPDVILMDLVMPRLDGVEAIRRIRERAPEARVVVLTSFGSDDRVLEAVGAGAAGYLLKDAEPREVEAAVRAAHRGEALLDPAVTAGLLRGVAGGQRRRSRGADLTPREHEVLTLIACGRSNRQIADELVIAEKTVKTHVSNLLAKLEVTDRTQAAVLALREGLVEDPDQG